MKIFFIVFWVISPTAFANTYHIYLDTDFSNNVQSGEAIRNGMQTAIDYYQKNRKISKFTVEIKSLDHRANTRRSLKNFKDALNDKKMLAVFGGLHSPPLITNKSFINENMIPTLVPWAAGGPITRTAKKLNWIFRLSVDDSQAGEFISKSAIKEGCKKPHLILEKTPWGKSNEKNMRQSLDNLNNETYDISFFDWSITKSSATDISNSNTLASNSH